MPPADAQRISAARAETALCAGIIATYVAIIPWPQAATVPLADAQRISAASAETALCAGIIATYVAIIP